MSNNNGQAEQGFLWIYLGDVRYVVSMWNRANAARDTYSSHLLREVLLDWQRAIRYGHFATFTDEAREFLEKFYASEPSFR